MSLLTLLHLEEPDDSYGGEIFEDVPVAWYRMGEASGAVIDFMGGTSGTVVGTVTRDVPGATGGSDDGAIEFPGTGTNRVTVADQTKLDLGDGPYTIEVWVKVDAHKNYNCLISKGTNGYELFLDAAGKINTGKSDVAIEYTGSTVLSLGEWHHIVWVHDPTSRVVYLDGEAETLTGAPLVMANNNSVLAIGDFAGGAGVLDGAMDEVAIYNYILDPARVTAHYDAATAGPVSVTPDVATLTTASFAPTVATPRLVTPGKLATTLTTFAPTVQTPRVVTPAVASLVTAKFAPTVSAPRLVTAGLATLTTATFAPIAVAPRLVTPATAALTTETFAPTLDATADQTVIPGTAALELASFAPTVTAEAGQVATPSTAPLTTEAFAPTVTATANQVATPATAELELASFAPQVAAGVYAVPAVKALTLTAFAPTVATTADVLVTPAPAALVLSLFAPDVTGEVVVPEGGHINVPWWPTREKYVAPRVERRKSPVTVTPRSVTLRLVGSAPVVTVNDDELAMMLLAA
jgi:hypothetical protein